MILMFYFFGRKRKQSRGKMNRSGKKGERTKNQKKKTTTRPGVVRERESRTKQNQDQKERKRNPKRIKEIA
jgi:hypothetical protein